MSIFFDDLDVFWYLIFFVDLIGVYVVFSYLVDWYLIFGLYYKDEDILFM